MYSNKAAKTSNARLRVCRPSTKPKRSSKPNTAPEAIEQMASIVKSMICLRAIMT